MRRLISSFAYTSTRSLMLCVSLLCFSMSSNAALPVGQLLISAAVDSLKPYGANDLSAMVKPVDVTGQSFNKALRIDTYGKSPGKSEFGLTAELKNNLNKGDVLWVSFKARKLESKRETGDASFELRFDQLVNGKYRWPAHMDRGISFGSEWTEFSIPFVMGKDTTPADVRLIIKFDTYEQRFEISPITFINYGSQVKLSDLPRSVVSYEGGEADAPWRKEAAARIEKIRKGNLTVKVVNEKGLPIKGADVSISMTRNAYNWGTTVTSQLLLDNTAGGEKYREILRKYFNQVVFENEIKVKNWVKVPEAERGVRALQANEWLRKNGFSVRGHVMVWPSWNQTPPFAEYKNDPEKLRSKILESINDQTNKMRGAFDEWDVINEATVNHDYMDLLGQQEMVTWFKAARAGAPGVKLFYNDFTMFHGKGPGSSSQKFYDIVKYLKDNGAPIDRVGEQAHIGGTPPAISAVLERLDYFSQLGLPIQISEFDINSNDDDFKARYLTDFLTAVYSHPSTVGFVQWGFWEGAHWFPVAALWDKDWNIRKHGQAYVDLVTKTWWTDVKTKSANNGISKVRGFTGDYEITVNYKGKTAKQKFTLDNKGGAITVKL